MTRRMVIAAVVLGALAGCGKADLGWTLRAQPGGIVLNGDRREIGLTREACELAATREQVVEDRYTEKYDNAVLGLAATRSVEAVREVKLHTRKVFGCTPTTAEEAKLFRKRA